MDHRKALEIARDWFRKTERSPKRIDVNGEVWWRWTLADVGEREDKGYLLPFDVFGQLRSCDSRHKHLFRTYARARDAAVMAAFHAVMSGWQPVFAPISEGD